MADLTLVLIAMAALIGWAGSLYLWPFAPCGRCEGSGRNRGSNRERWGQCRRCKGSGTRRRIGASIVHRGAVSLAEKARKGR